MHKDIDYAQKFIATILIEDMKQNNLLKNQIKKEHYKYTI